MPSTAAVAGTAAVTGTAAVAGTAAVEGTAACIHFLIESPSDTSVEEAGTAVEPSREQQL